MALILLKLLAVWLPALYIALRLLPLAGPGRFSFCLGASGIFALVTSGAVMWLVLETSGLILPWAPVVLIWLLAGAAALAGRMLPPPVRPPFGGAAGRERLMRRGQNILLTVLLALMSLRVASLVPDVLLRPLFAWDAWTVWAYEARVWFEAGAFVEFQPPWEWLSAPAEAFVRDNLVLYPRLVPALILWAAAGSPTWTGVGPGLLWLAVAVMTALLIYGVLRLAGLKPVWGAAAAYAFLSLPLVSAHAALYGYADLWLAALIALFSAFLVLDARDQRWLWRGLALLVLLSLPLVKLEGVYWLVCGLAAWFAVRMGLGLRTIMLLSVAGALGLLLVAQLGIDLLAWLTSGRLETSADGVQRALAGGVRHSFIWFDWHLLVYLTIALVLLLAVRPRLGEGMRALAVFCVFGLVILWGLTPLSGAGEFLADGTLFSRIFLQLSPAFILLGALLVDQVFRASPVLERGPGLPLARSVAVMGGVAVVLWVGWSAWALTSTGSRQLVPPLVIEPDASSWRMAEGAGQLVEAGFEVTAPGPRGRTVLAVELPAGMRGRDFDAVELRFAGPPPQSLSMGWSRRASFQPTGWTPMDAIEGDSIRLALHDQPRWPGSVYWLAIEQIGFTGGAWQLESIRVHFAPLDWRRSQRLLLDSVFIREGWLQRNPAVIWTPYSVPRISPVLGVALWSALSALLLWLLLPHIRARALVCLAVPVALGWLALDLRWQVELGYKARSTIAAFAAHPPDQRFAHDIDGAMYEFLASLRAAYPRSEFERIFAFSDTEFWRKRARYHLAAWAVRAAPAAQLNPAFAQHLRSGDLLLLLETPGLSLAQSEEGDEPVPANRVEVRSGSGQLIVVGERILESGDWVAVRVD